MTTIDTEAESLGASDRAIVDAFAAEAGEVFPVLGATRPGDDALLDRLAERALAGASVGTSTGTAGLAKTAGLALVGVLAVAGAVAVLARSERTGAPAQIDATPVPAEPAERSPDRAPIARPAAASETIPLAAAIVEPEAALERSTKRARVADMSPRAVEPGLDAAALLRRANAARQAGAYERARDDYLELRARFAGSREDLLARVSLGNLELSRFSRPEAALAQFEAYLRDQPGGNLAEEVSLGRIHALGRLGRREAELLALRDFEARFAGSVHGPELARRRAELSR